MADRSKLPPVNASTWLIVVIALIIMATLFEDDSTQAADSRSLSTVILVGRNECHDAFAAQVVVSTNK